MDLPNIQPQPSASSLLLRLACSPPCSGLSPLFHLIGEAWSLFHRPLRGVRSTSPLLGAWGSPPSPSLVAWVSPPPSASLVRGAWPLSSSLATSLQSPPPQLYPNFNSSPPTITPNSTLVLTFSTPPTFQHSSIPPNFSNLYLSPFLFPLTFLFLLLPVTGCSPRLKTRFQEETLANFF